MTQETIAKVDSKPVEIGLETASRQSISKSLSKLLASTYCLYIKTLYYHWNVKGQHFATLHELFETQYQDLHSAGDELAERIRALGHFVPGTMKEFLELSVIQEDKTMPEAAEKMVENLLKDNETLSKEARKILKEAETAEDEITVDMMVGRMTYHDKTAWMLRATLG